MMTCVLLFISLLVSSIAHAAVTVDAVMVSGGSGDFGDDSFTHMVATDANFLAVCTTTHGGSGDNNTIDGVTSNGNGLTPLVAAQSLGSLGFAHLWYQLAPSVGANDIVVDVAADPWYVNVAISFKGVVQSAPTNTQSAEGGGDVLELTITSDTDELVLDCMHIATGGGEDPIASPGSGQAQQWDAGHDTLWTVGSTMDGASPSATPDWTFGFGSTYWSHVAVSLEPMSVMGRRRVPVIWR